MYEEAGNPGRRQAGREPEKQEVGRRKETGREGEGEGRGRMPRDPDGETGKQRGTGRLTEAEWQTGGWLREPGGGVLQAKEGVSEDLMVKALVGRGSQSSCVYI